MAQVPNGRRGRPLRVWEGRTYTRTRFNQAPPPSRVKGQDSPPMGSGQWPCVDLSGQRLHRGACIPSSAWHVGQLGRAFRSVQDVGVCGGPCRHPGRTVSPSWEDQTPPCSWPPLPTLGSSLPAGVWGPQGASHPEGVSAAAEAPGQVRSQGFLQEERMWSRRRSPQEAEELRGQQRCPAGTAGAVGAGGQRGRPTQPLPPGPELQPRR